MGARFCRRRSDRYARVAQGPQRRRFLLGKLSEPGRRGRSVADADPCAGLGLMPRLRSPVRGGGAQPRFWVRRDISSIRTRGLSDRRARGRPTPGRRSTCRAPAGSAFDPTNRGVGGFNLIPVGVARDIRQVMTVVGSFVGDSDAFQAMSVEVAVTKVASTGRAEALQTDNAVD